MITSCAHCSGGMPGGGDVPPLEAMPPCPSIRIFEMTKISHVRYIWGCLSSQRCTLSPRRPSHYPVYVMRLSIDTLFRIRLSPNVPLLHIFTSNSIKIYRRNQICKSLQKYKKELLKLSRFFLQFHTYNDPPPPRFFFFFFFFFFTQWQTCHFYFLSASQDFAKSMPHTKMLYPGAGTACCHFQNIYWCYLIEMFRFFIEISTFHVRSS